MTNLTSPLNSTQLPPSNNQAHAATGRNRSLDLLKAVAILMVIFYHNRQLNPDSMVDNLLMMIPNAAVPCFFMASGAVFFHRPVHMQKHLRKTVRFYLILVAWKAIYLVLYLNWGAPLNGSLRALMSYLFLFQHMDGIETAHFWFMDAMLTVMLVSPLLHLCYHTRSEDETTAAGVTNRLLPGHSQLLLFVLAVLLLFNQLPAAGNLLIRVLSQLAGKPAWDIAALGEVNPFSFRNSNYLTYYLLGALLIEYKKRIPARTAAILALLGTAGLVCIKYIQTGSFRWNGVYLESGYYWISTMLLAVGLFLLMLRLNIREHTPAGWIAAYAGSSTMGIFYLHIPLIFILTPTVFARFQAYNGWILNLADSLLVAGIALAITWVFGLMKSAVKKGFQS